MIAPLPPLLRAAVTPGEHHGAPWSACSAGLDTPLSPSYDGDRQLAELRALTAADTSGCGPGSPLSPTTGRSRTLPRPPRAGPPLHRLDRRTPPPLYRPTLAAGGPATATDLAERLPITRQAISKHLALLAEVGLVTAEPGERRRVRYRLRRTDAGGAAVPGRAGPRLGLPAGRTEGSPRPLTAEEGGTRCTPRSPPSSPRGR